MGKCSKTPFRIVGGNGEWWAYHAFRRFPIWGARVEDIAVPTRGGWAWLQAVKGRTPFEALERLKRVLGRCDV